MEGMSLFEVLSMDERIIVYSSEEDRIFYTWNQSLTLQCWAQDAKGWREINVRTLSQPPANYGEARQAAMNWHFN